jgi:hypothetical protein
MVIENASLREVRLLPEVDSGGRRQISTNGGEIPLWSPDGRGLFYYNGEAIMAVSVKTDPSFRLPIHSDLSIAQKWAENLCSFKVFGSYIGGSGAILFAR